MDRSIQGWWRKMMAEVVDMNNTGEKSYSGGDVGQWIWLRICRTTGVSKKKQWKWRNRRMKK